MQRKPKSLTLSDVIAKLRAKQGERSLREFARELGISAPYLSDIYLGKRQPGAKILKQFGLSAKKQTSVEYQQTKEGVTA